jgi:hypothetical protein
MNSNRKIFFHSARILSVNIFIALKLLSQGITLNTLLVLYLIEFSIFNAVTALSILICHEKKLLKNVFHLWKDVEKRFVPVTDKEAMAIILLIHGLIALNPALVAFYIVAMEIFGFDWATIEWEKVVPYAFCFFLALIAQIVYIQVFQKKYLVSQKKHLVLTKATDEYAREIARRIFFLFSFSIFSIVLMDILTKENFTLGTSLVAFVFIVSTGILEFSSSKRNYYNS